MFAIVKDGIIQQTIRANRAFVYAGVSYGDRWCQRMSAADKEALGIMEVVQGARADERFYWVSPSAILILDGVPTQTYTAVAKDLAALKAQFIAQEKENANKVLAATDWMVIRKAERNVDLPEETKAQRAAIVQTCTEKETAIAAATTIEELIDIVAPVEVAEEVIVSSAAPVSNFSVEILSGNAEGNSDV